MPSLDGLVVLDFSNNLPGPYATQLLAMQGARVIKVESPRGDPGRNIPALFERLNAGKQSVVLDLRDEADRARLKPLVEAADVIVEGFRPGVIERLGCGFEQASAWNPRVVYCSISAYGQDGPGRELPAHDLNLQALCGLNHLERDPRGRPREVVLPVADLSASLSAVAAIALALVERERTGRGRYLDVSMLDALADWTAIWAGSADLLAQLRQQGPAADALADSPVFREHRRRKLYALPHYGVFRCRGGEWLALGIVDEDPFWRRLCKALSLRGIGRLPLPARALLGSGLRQLVAARLRTRSRAHWLAVLQEADVPATPVLSAAQAASEPRVVHRAGQVLPGSQPIRSGAPALGEHQVLAHSATSASAASGSKTRPPTGAH